MLNRHQTVCKRASASLVLSALALVLGSAGCGSTLSGEQDTTVHFLVEPKSDGTFFGWTEITVDGDINSVGVANLYGVTLGLQTPTSTLTDLTFLSTLTGQAVTPTTTTTVAHLDSFPPDESTVSLHIDYLGDLHPLFESSSTIRINWIGTVNPAFKAWPTGGIRLQGTVVINIQ